MCENILQGIKSVREKCKGDTGVKMTGVVSVMGVVAATTAV